MSYQPLILRLEVKSGASQIGFDESSKLDVEQSPSAAEKTRRRLMSGMKKRTPPAAAVRVDDDSDAPLAPTGAKHKTQQVVRPQTSCRGRRTYSEVVVETLEGDRLSELLSTDGEAHSSRFSKAGSEPHGPVISSIERIKIIRDATPNQYMIILKFKSYNDTVVFFEEFNGIQFNSMEPNRCVLLFVDRMECASEDQLINLSSGGDSQLTEIPTCAVCLERMDDGVVSILCNHSFHAGCLQKWTDTTCPVCRYIQTPELVAEQQCSDCGQSTDLWICLICGNIGCGRYAEAHAYSILRSATAELKEEREMNAMLRSDQQVWKEKVHQLEKHQAASEITFSTVCFCILCIDLIDIFLKVILSFIFSCCICLLQQIKDLEEQIRDLMLHFEAQSKIQLQLAASQVTQEPSPYEHEIVI
uniref:RING-type domain-containing protein n=1 Tax=Heterorhabditis bacteriophora TaxID=37862 RepID=A0A1I7X9M7_HETBA